MIGLAALCGACCLAVSACAIGGKNASRGGDAASVARHGKATAHAARSGKASTSQTLQASSGRPADGVYNVRLFGAKGDGATLDTNVINRAIATAAGDGGGTVFFPPGVYRSFSIHLASHVTLRLGPGATLLAAGRKQGEPGYDPPEPNRWDQDQDYGHSHWHDSLIWGEGLSDVAIEGPGLIDGWGLTRRDIRTATGYGNKILALKNCRGFTMRDVTMYRGGHFCVLLTGVDDVLFDNVKMDTNRDGIDVDCCRNVRVSNCTINSPEDDGLVFKATMALGKPIDVENVTVVNCQVSGYDMGTLLDGTRLTTQRRGADGDGPTGRIKFGTESIGGFKNVAISNCTFDHCRGLALETVDGGSLENFTVSNLSMRDMVSSPIFLRIGSRTARGVFPFNPTPGRMRRISISNVEVLGSDQRFPIQIMGLPGHPIQDVTLDNIRVLYEGGLSLEDVKEQPNDLVVGIFSNWTDAATRNSDPNQNDLSNEEASGPRQDPFAVPERAHAYPEPSIFGLLPAYGLYARHVQGLTALNVQFGFRRADSRPAIVLDDAQGVDFDRVKASVAGGAAAIVLRQVKDFRAAAGSMADARIRAAGVMKLR
jgi:polygalacturonase